MNAEQVAQTIRTLITEDHMQRVPQDDRAYTRMVGPFVDHVEDSIAGLGHALGVPFEEAFVIIVGTVLQRQD